jgi:hypothetical protein
MAYRYLNLHYEPKVASVLKIIQASIKGKTRIKNTGLSLFTSIIKSATT